MKKFRLLCLGLFTAFFLAVNPACADEYVKPSLETAAKAMVRFGAVDLSDNKVLDTFARIIACDIYAEHFKDEFRWEKIRPIIREHIRQDIPHYPTKFRYETVLKLGRYDFNKKMYPFEEKSQRSKINLFPFRIDNKDVCGGPLEAIPTAYSLVLDKGVDIDGIPLEEKEAKELVIRMEQDKNNTHLVFIRFNIRVMFIASLGIIEGVSKDSSNPNVLAVKTAQVTQKNDSGKGMVFDAKLESVEYFEDEKFTRLIYKYRP
jgi:hypothetical protein